MSAHVDIARTLDPASQHSVTSGTLMQPKSPASSRTSQLSKWVNYIILHHCLICSHTVGYWHCICIWVRLLYSAYVAVEYLNLKHGCSLLICVADRQLWDEGFLPVPVHRRLSSQCLNHTYNALDQALVGVTSLYDLGVELLCCWSVGWANCSGINPKLIWGRTMEGPSEAVLESGGYAPGKFWNFTCKSVHFGAFWRCLCKPTVLDWYFGGAKIYSPQFFGGSNHPPRPPWDRCHWWPSSVSCCYLWSWSIWV